jgi:hypothetical protein
MKQFHARLEEGWREAYAHNKVMRDAQQPAQAEWNVV